MSTSLLSACITATHDHDTTALIALTCLPIMLYSHHSVRINDVEWCAHIVPVGMFENGCTCMLKYFPSLDRSILLENEGYK